jgi:8-oxo-dGTP pyrophosphatase MutT (NUDIX family)
MTTGDGHLFSDAAALRPAAVLVPVISRGSDLSVLFTRRTDHLHDHAGQISFPGGRAEPHEESAAQTALRETEEEIGLARSAIDVLGFLPDHLIVTGYAITPVVALVAPSTPLRLDPVEVAAVFEVPLAYVLDPANHRLRRRPAGEGVIELYDIPYGKRNIWGATAGMLITLCRLLMAPIAAASAG